MERECVCGGEEGRDTEVISNVQRERETVREGERGREGEREREREREREEGRERDRGDIKHTRTHTDGVPVSDRPRAQGQHRRMGV